MITVKPYRLSALLLCLVLLFTACQSSNPSPYTLGDPNTLAETHHSPFAEYLYVILPAEAEASLAARAQVFTDALRAQTEIPSELCYDDQILPKRENVAYVLLGYTNAFLSRVALSPLKRDDYLCRWDGEHRTLILGGKSAAATIAAIDRFSEDLLPYADASLLMSAHEEFLVSAEYPISKLNLNGHSLGSYTMVYPKGATPKEIAVLSALREALADRCGLYPDILCESEVRTTERRILLSIEPTATTTAQMLSDETVITLSGASSYELAAAAEALLALLAPETAEGEISVTLPAVTDVPVSRTEAGLLALSLPQGLAASPDTLSEVYTAVHTLWESEAAIGLSDGLAPSLLPILSESLPAYTILHKEATSAYAPMLCYRADMLTLVSSETVCETGGVVQAYRFSLNGTSLSFTLIHAYIEDTQHGNDALEAIRRATASAKEPVLVVGYLPAVLSLSLEGESMLSVTQPLPQARHAAIVYLPNGESATLTAGAADSLYVLCPNHPFLLSH